jgi:hypothetical protein
VLTFDSTSTGGGAIPPDQQAECPRCEGREYIQDGDVFHLCTCAFSKAKRRFLGDDIYDAAKIRSSPLLEVTQDQRWTTRDMTSSSLWITSEWCELLPHLRYALGEKWRVAKGEFTFRVITDETIRAANYAEGREGAERIADLVSSRTDLLIVRLGFLGAAIATAPEILLGTLRQRIESVGRPVWVTDTPSFPFSAGAKGPKSTPKHPCWSTDAETYLRTPRFLRGRLTPEAS